MCSSKKKKQDIILQTTDLSVWETCLSGMIMGFIAYSGSFSTVPILFTLTALKFGTKSFITIFSTAFAQLAAGYLHTHSSRTGMSISTTIFHGFYIAKTNMRNRRKFNETRIESLKRFFIFSPMNALVLNIMWETFTIYYIIHTILFLKYVDCSTSNNDIEMERKLNETISLSSSSKELAPRLLVINGITRYLAGCLSGMSTGLINQLWQRYQSRSKIPHAILNTNKKILKLEWEERKKLLSPRNLENWIKASVMLTGAIFIIACSIPNRSGLHLLDVWTKRLISDVLVIHGGWFIFRDSAMLVLKKKEKSLQPPSIMVETPLITKEVPTVDECQSETLPDKV